jgi:transcriptional regulator with XRE-family HTH domain
MNPSEYLAALKALKLSKSAAGRLLGVTETTGIRWAADGLPPTAERLLRLVLALNRTIGLKPEQVSDLIERHGK